MGDEQKQQHKQKEHEQDLDHDQGQQEEEQGQDEQEEMMEATPSPVAGPLRLRLRSPSPSQPSLQQAPTPDVAPTLGDSIPKRQRRPNVRLNEIGEISVEFSVDRKAGDNIKAPPGKPPKKLSISPKFHANDADYNDDDDDDHLPSPPAPAPSPAPAPTPAPAPAPAPKLSEKRSPQPSKTASKQLRLGRRHRPAPSATRRTTHPLQHDANDDSSMHKAMTGNTDGFVHVADGSISGCSDTEKHVKLSSRKDFEMRPRGSSFKKSLKKTQSPKIKKKMVSGNRAPAQVQALKMEVEEKEEPLSSDVQELRVHGPVWEKGVVPFDEQVRDWIRGIGMEKYASLFQHHEVVNDCLPLLTMDDLKEMGIAAVGARRKLFNEILKLKQGLMLADDMKTD